MKTETRGVTVFVRLVSMITLMFALPPFSLEGRLCACAIVTDHKQAQRTQHFAIPHAMDFCPCPDRI